MFAVRPVGLVKSAFVWRPTISSDVTNWVLYSQAIAAGWDGTTPLDAEVTVGSGIVLSANSTSLYGFDTGSGFPVGTSLKLIMPGYVCGMGGDGRRWGFPANSGGPALRAQYAITIDAAGGTIAGGGGGGGAGDDGSSNYIGGGGGQSGRTNSAGGLGSSSPYNGLPGTFSGPGNSGTGGSSGKGGTWGSSGATGMYGSAGGSGGAAVVGNSYITWINTGTRYGAIT